MTSAPSLMLIHGMWSRPFIWDNFRHYFEERGHTVITPTLRFHDTVPGARPHEGLGTCSLLDFADDLEREILALDTPPLLIGHSMGGLLAQMLAARGLARAVVGLAPAPCRGAALFDPLVPFILGRALAAWREPQLPGPLVMKHGVLNRLPPDERARIYGAMIPESGRALFEIIFWYLDETRASCVDPRDVSCPLLFLAGTRDHLTSVRIARATADLYDEKARFVPLKGHGHWLVSEPGWEAIAEECSRFFDALPRLRTAPAGALAHARSLPA